LRALIAQAIKTVGEGGFALFVVKCILKRGIFRDRVLIAATKDAALSRKRLGMDHTGCLEPRIENLRAAEGEEFVVLLPRDSMAEGQTITAEQAASLSAFHRLWRAESA
jgi:hypothetical protein